MRRALSSALFPYTTLFRSFYARVKYTASGGDNSMYVPPDGGDINADPTPQWDNLADAQGDYHWNNLDNTDRKSTRLNSSHGYISYAALCSKKNNTRSPWAR